MEIRIFIFYFREQRMPRAARYKTFEKIQDFVSVLKGVWFLILLDAIALYAFMLAPQGADVLLSIAEDVGTHFPHEIRVAPAICLVLSLLSWSVASEFCSRFLIYITDSSGKSLSPDRVQIRKQHRKTVARMFLFYPPILMISGLTKVLLLNYADMEQTRYVIIGICSIILLLLLIILVLYRFYVRGGILRIARKYPSLQWITISAKEKEWVRKLYGILNDVRIDIPASNCNYKGIDLPRNEELPNGITLPNSEYFEPYEDNPQTDGNLQVWMFHINRGFYRSLLRQLYVFVFFALLLIFLFGIVLPVGAFLNVGAIAIICFAFASWQVVYTAIHYIDKIQTAIPVRLLLVLVLMIFSFVNNDHPVRNTGAGKSLLPQRPTLQEHFSQWLVHLENDTSARQYRVNDSIPVIFVAAEGGALRTGAFTAMMLAKLSQQFPEMNKHIYCYSGVSGGALGLNYYNATYINHVKNGDTSSYDVAASNFFKRDFLSAVTGRLVFGEVINAFLPFHINRMDRAIALESSWEDAWSAYYGNKQDNILAAPFTATIDTTLPAVFINTTSVETGLQCFWSNVEPRDMPLAASRDLYARFKKNLMYSSAINLSTRFPLISPGATFLYKMTDDLGDSVLIKRHFVDGGYYENKGAETLLQVMQALQLEGKKVKPYVLQFSFGIRDTSVLRNTGVSGFNEVSEIIFAIFNTRSGRGSISDNYLHEYVKKINGVFINLELNTTTRSVPLNWILSNKAVDRISQEVASTVYIKAANARDNQALKKLFVYDSEALQERKK